MKILTILLSLLQISQMLSAASVMVLNFGNTQGASHFDTEYQDEESAVFASAGNRPDISGTLAGRNYGDSIVGERWGVLDNSRPWNHGEQGGLIRAGFEPDEIGSTKSTAGSEQTDASYLSFEINPDSQMLFEGLAVRLDQSQTICVVETAWASTSLDNFATAYPLVNQLGGHAVAAEWAFVGLEATADQPFEIRIYGVIGADEGVLPSIKISGFATPVPEPSLAGLIGIFSLGSLVGRRRR